MPEALRLSPAFAVGLHVIGEYRVHQHRHVAANVVKDVRLLQVIELVAAADEACRRELPTGEKIEKHVVGHQPRHCGDAPAGRPVENVAEPSEIGDAAGGDAEPGQAVQVLAAGAVDQQPLLALEQQAPDRMLFLAVSRPILLDHVVPDIAHRALRRGGKTPLLQV